MTSAPRWPRMLRENCAKLGLVFAAFFLMALAGCLAINNIMGKELSHAAGESLNTAESQIMGCFSEADAVLSHAAILVRGLKREDHRQEAILGYLTRVTDWMRRRDGLMTYFTGIYGFMDGELIDSIGLHPGQSFRSRTRPWYQAGLHSGGRTVFTPPYIDARTKKMIISAVRALDNDQGEIEGVLALDLNMTWLLNSICALGETANGYGIIVNQNLDVQAHPDSARIGRPLRDLGPDYQKIAESLTAGREVSAMKIKDAGGRPAIVFFKRIFNGWQVGLVVSVDDYYRSMYQASAALMILGAVFMAVLGYILLHMDEARLRAEEANRALALASALAEKNVMLKNTFLARMSHEIRTPMNAIIGMSDLARREPYPPKAREYIAGIRQAGANLLAIINDILDFSKIEAGNFPLHPAPYEMSALLSDTLATIRVQLLDKPVEFITDISPALPGRLTGDATRVRQVLLNLLSNAVKYTDRGFIRFTAAGERCGETGIKLVFAVEDSGGGIQDSDINSLFSDFVRLEEEKHENIEGSGLGLTIARNLCRAMSGEITVESEYGRGSTFTATLRQSVRDWTPLGEMPPAKADLPGDWRAPFIAPEVSLLLVDDLPSNLLVAEGLLAPWQTRVTTCLSGREALALAREQSFDLVFLDHMMPDMDGLEAARAIRALEGERYRRLPIIALTANAMAGMEEMFLQNGFNDFLSKPIEIPKLSAIMEKWIPAAKRLAGPETGPNPSAIQPPFDLKLEGLYMEGIDLAVGLSRVGGSREQYLNVLEMFGRDAAARWSLLGRMSADAERPALATQFHALKSGLANIGAEALSQRAARLEEASRCQDAAFVHLNFAPFLEALGRLVSRIKAGLVAARPEGGELEAGLARAALTRLREELEGENIGGINRELQALQALPLDHAAREAAAAIAELVLRAEFIRAADVIGDHLKCFEAE
ncbi:MAG: response regulator [Candidatus Adiutrix sp.]|jgi:signal transduction histidine kinase/CheY-like chemotaxis protein/HPt (histidine-containing phosphotransfer) domain-containing protein|nr:response regulator [Candidatus Adiutrix sp.]